jgi:uncharacterized membrane protein YqjE
MDDSGTRKRPPGRQRREPPASAANSNARGPNDRPPVRQQAEPAAATTSGQGLGDTVAGIVEDLQGIVRGEVQLAKTELKEDATKMGKGAGMLAGAGVLGLVGFIFLMLSLTYLLDRWMPLWVAAGLVGLTLAIIAAIVGMAGKNQIQSANLVPEQTIESVKEDKEWASRQMKSVRK